MAPPLTSRRARLAIALVRRRDRLAVLTGLNLALLLVLWLLENYVAERHWLTTLLLYAPQHGFGGPSLLLGLWALGRRHWWALASNMAGLAFFVFTLLGCRLPLPNGANPSVVALRVMTYNVNFGSRRPAAIARVVQAAGPQILCLQETRGLGRQPDPVPALQKLLPGWHMARAAEVTTFSRYPIAAQRVHPMPKPGTRAVLETVVLVQGRRLTVLNAHISTFANLPRPLWQRYPTRNQLWLHHPGLYTSATAATRRQQVEFLLRVAALIKTPLLVMGDFNNPPRGLLYRRLTERFQDSFTVAGAGTGLGHTYPDARPLMRIDYVFADKSIAVQSCRVPNVRASDHRPVVVDAIFSP